MNIVFAGTPQIARVTLQKILLSGGFSVNAVFTKPDSRAGRGKKLSTSPVKDLALEHNIKILQPDSLRNNAEIIKELKNLKPDIMIVVAYGLILPQEVLDIPLLGCINVHVSLLPKYRGAAPIQRAVLNGDLESGVTIMQMDIGLDTGDVLLQRAIKLDSNETSGSLHDRLAALGADMVIEYLNNYKTITPIKQNNSETSYAAKLEKSEAQINWGEGVTVIERKIRGFNPFPGCFTHINGKLLKIWQAETSILSTEKDAGTIIHVDDSSLYIACGDGGVLKILELQEEGNIRQSAKIYLLKYKELLNKRLG